MPARKKGSVVLSPDQAKLVNSILKQNVAGNVNKSAFALYGNIYQFPNYGRYRPRYYVQQDTEQGLDPLSRELLVRWSREMTSQLGFIESAIRVKANFSVGDAYLPEYTGKNEKWGEIARDWLLEEFYPNCCNRGKAFDFQTVMALESQMLDIDGDLLCVYGKSNTGFPKFQIIPSHRIRSISTTMYSEANGYIDKTQPGPYPGTVLADGVLYNMQGEPLGYNVVNANNLVHSLDMDAKTVMFSTKNSMLVYDPRYFDKGRGRPSIGSAILQALSLQEIETYLMEKLKIESTVGLIEATPSGEGPLELQDTLAALNAQAGNTGIFSPSPNVHGVEIVDGPTIRYIKASGGDLKSLASSTPANESQNYITRLEKHVLSTIGVPHELLFSQNDVSGRISDGVSEIFNRAIIQRQRILDNHAKFIISWALANAMKNGYIPENYDENLYKAFDLTHPAPFSLNQGYQDKFDLEAYKTGTKSLNELAKKRNTTAKDIISDIEKETGEFIEASKRVATKTGVDMNTVMQIMRESMNGGQAQPVQPPQSEVGEKIRP